ncbi:MAG: transcriptional repressor LexA [Anaerolineales bacterium]|nr:transcriptional repressor LexA [Anaerolineales bacterium]MCB8992010.1 repressor LexA [Ardenticatenaceae bacterium]MCB9004592.1 repressor LexA [Ardenticatenaceae bacterium]
MKKEKPLSKRQRSILNYILDYLQKNRRPPTIREIGSATAISSTSVVNYNLERLTERGMLEREAEVSRGLRLTDKGLLELGRVGEAMVDLADAVSEAVSRIVKVPLLGNIVAGEPIEVGNNDFATYDEDDALEVSATMLPTSRTDDLFALRVSGVSMIDAMVNDGDIVIMRQQEVAKNGDMVAVWLNGSDTTTLKHFYHEGDRIRLQPANPTMEPIYVEPEDVRVQGKVMMVLRQTA